MKIKKGNNINKKVLKRSVVLEPVFSSILYKIPVIHKKESNFKLDLQRLKRILINSCEQCGRTDLMEIELLNDVKEYLNLYPNSIIIDFSNNLLENSLHVESFLVGPEGGFSKKERELFEKNKIFGLKSQNILKSQTAVLGVCAKILL